METRVEMQKIGKTGGGRIYGGFITRRLLQILYRRQNGKKKYKIDPYSFAYEVQRRVSCV